MAHLRTDRRTRFLCPDLRCDATSAPFGAANLPESPITLLTATGIAAAIPAGRLSAAEALEDGLRRAEQGNPALNAIIAWRLPEARAEAAAADAARAAGAPVGPLHGVPMTVKESFDVAGLPTTLGHPDWRDHRAERDSVAVARLKAAGAIIFGKTNVPKDLADWQSDNAVYGRTLNPWDTTRSPGGSSGGAAAALAAGLTDLEIGSDIGGSIRMPAHFCGVYGHKPTYGIVPMRGHGLDPDGAPSDLSVAGPLARCPADLEIALRVLAGPDGDDAAAWRFTPPPEPRTALRDFRVAVITDDATYPVDAPIAAAVRSVAETLRSAGARVAIDPPWPKPSAAQSALYVALLRGATSERLSDADAAAIAAQAAGLPPDANDYRAQMLRGLSQSHAAWHRANQARQHLRQAWRDWFGDYDALICPVAPFVAFRHIVDIPKPDQRADINGEPRPVSDAYFWLGLATLSYLPATTIPAGATSGGLPIGAQIIAPAYQDLRCLRLAGLLEAAHGGFRRPRVTAKPR